jgi:hypothetical protein
MASTINSGQGAKKSIVVVTQDGAVITQIGTRILKGTLSGSNTYTLPDARSNKFQTWTIDNDTGSDLVVNTVSSQSINGQMFQVVPNNNSMTVYSNGNNFRII